MAGSGEERLVMPGLMCKRENGRNYFGEVSMWWGLFVLALSLPWGWISIVGPLTITSTILFVSGIPMTEKLLINMPFLSLRMIFRDFSQVLSSTLSETRIAYEFILRL
jgi:hypothetical protein